MTDKSKQSEENRKVTARDFYAMVDRHFGYAEGDSERLYRLSTFHKANGSIVSAEEKEARLNSEFGT